MNGRKTYVDKSKEIYKEKFKKELLSVKEFKNIFEEKYRKISNDTLYNLISMENFPAINENGIVLVNSEEAFSWIRKNLINENGDINYSDIVKDRIVIRCELYEDEINKINKYITSHDFEFNTLKRGKASRILGFSEFCLIQIEKFMEKDNREKKKMGMLAKDFTVNVRRNKYGNNPRFSVIAKYKKSYIGSDSYLLNGNAEKYNKCMEFVKYCKENNVNKINLLTMLINLESGNAEIKESNKIVFC